MHKLIMINKIPSLLSRGL